MHQDLEGLRATYPAVVAALEEDLRPSVEAQGHAWVRDKDLTEEQRRERRAAAGGATAGSVASGSAALGPAGAAGGASSSVDELIARLRRSPCCVSVSRPSPQAIPSKPQMQPSPQQAQMQMQMQQKQQRAQQHKPTLLSVAEDRESFESARLSRESGSNDRPGPPSTAAAAPSQAVEKLPAARSGPRDKALRRSGSAPAQDPSNLRPAKRGAASGTASGIAAEGPPAGRSAVRASASPATPDRPLHRQGGRAARQVGRTASDLVLESLSEASPAPEAVLSPPREYASESRRPPGRGSKGGGGRRGQLSAASSRVSDL